MNHRRGWAAGLAALTLASAACSFSIRATTSGSAVPSQEPSPSPPASGPGSAAAAMRSLCVAPTPTGGKRAVPGDTPTSIAQVEQEVQSVRGLDWKHPVAVDPITEAQIGAKLTKSFDDTYPKAYYARRTLAWRALGVIPPTADLRTALLRFQTGQVIGFYDPATQRLVYVGSADPSFVERFTLAHELTHAIDDQHFDLSRLDPIAAHCQDERFQAALGAVEGSAQYFAYRTVLQYPGSDAPAVGGGGGSLAGVPPFLVAMQLWPYTAGQDFMTAMDARGGTAQIDRALEHLPVSTEQVMHPERYPYDVPTPVDIPDMAPALGEGWRDLDVMQVGEEFLRAMLALRLDDGTAATAAAGWDGGLYRAWTNGTHVAVLLSTVWDTNGDAAAFAQAMQDWLNAGETAGEVIASKGNRVVVGFATDPSALDALGSGAGD